MDGSFHVHNFQISCIEVIFDSKITIYIKFQFEKISNLGSAPQTALFFVIVLNFPSPPGLCWNYVSSCRCMKFSVEKSGPLTLSQWPDFMCLLDWTCFQLSNGPKIGILARKLTKIWHFASICTLVEGVQTSILYIDNSRISYNWVMFDSQIIIYIEFEWQNPSTLWGSFQTALFFAIVLKFLPPPISPETVLAKWVVLCTFTTFKNHVIRSCLLVKS